MFETKGPTRPQTPGPQMARSNRSEAAIRLQAEVWLNAAGQPIGNLASAWQADFISSHPNESGEVYVRQMFREVSQVLQALRCERLGDLARERLQAWLADRGNRLGGNTLTHYRRSLYSFGQYLEAKGLVPRNPAAGLKIPPWRQAQKREWRTFSPEQIRRLLLAALHRPIIQEHFFAQARTIEHGHITTDSWITRLTAIEPGDIPRHAAAAREYLKNEPERIRGAERLGYQRALLWKLTMLTGISNVERKALRIGSVILNTERPHLLLADRKTRGARGGSLPLTKDLVADLQELLRQRLEDLQENARRAGRPVPESLDRKDWLLPLPRFDAYAGKHLRFDAAFAGLAVRSKTKDRWRGYQIDTTDVGKQISLRSLRDTYRELWQEVGQRVDRLPCFPIRQAESIDGALRTLAVCEPQRTVQSEQECSPAWLAERLDVHGDTLHSYAKAAGLRVPRRGERNFRYTVDAMRSLLNWINKKRFLRSDTRVRAQKLLAEIEG